MVDLLPLYLLKKSFFKTIIYYSAALNANIIRTLKAFYAGETDTTADCDN